MDNYFFKLLDCTKALKYLSPLLKEIFDHFLKFYCQPRATNSHQMKLKSLKGQQKNPIKWEPSNA